VDENPPAVMGGSGGARLPFGRLILTYSKKGEMKTKLFRLFQIEPPYRSVMHLFYPLRQAATG
jgi:hypothetical protein